MDGKVPGEHDRFKPVLCGTRTALRPVRLWLQVLAALIVLTALFA